MSIMQVQIVLLLVSCLLLQTLSLSARAPSSLYIRTKHHRFCAVLCSVVSRMYNKTYCNERNGFKASLTFRLFTWTRLHSILTSFFAVFCYRHRDHGLVMVMMVLIVVIMV